ncbi:unnamed protein product [Sphagnum jensenii]|uniref:Uncharacterized protein n=1 Tax=Sphagnum jensenii TaxID=128206 RepID=A0ABP0VKV2_9BRYO
MTVVPISQTELDTRLQDAGGAKGLVDGVIAVLEHAISVYKRDRNSFDETLLEPLKLDLDVLITITKEMADLMQFQSDQDQQVLENALRAIGDCNAMRRELQRDIDEVNEKVARGIATAADENARLKELDDAINENNRKIAECRERMDRALKWLWVPGYKRYLLGTLLDLCTNEQSRLSEKNAVNAEWKSTEEHLEALRAGVDMLTGKKRVMQCKIHALEESKKGFEQRSKFYAARIAVAADVILYYHLLRNAIENMEENLDLPKQIEKLNDSRELVLSTGEVRQDTLKGALIHLGEDYDRYKKYNGLVEGVTISFKLFKIHELLPREYRLATVQEVNRHPEELYKAMPSWEIANLVDGSVAGALYGGSTSLQIRNDVGHKLAMIETEPDMTEPDMTFTLLGINEQLPLNCRLATVQEVKKHRDALFEAMPSWEIANLADGSVDGACYGGSVRRKIRNDVGHKLVVPTDPGLTFKLFNINEQLPLNYRLATVQEVCSHRHALFEAMPNWEIANLADGSVDGARYGGQTRRCGSQACGIRNDVGHKLAVASTENGS